VGRLRNPSPPKKCPDRTTEETEAPSKLGGKNRQKSSILDEAFDQSRIT
jgi:hypothetical protein